MSKEKVKQAQEESQESSIADLPLEEAVKILAALPPLEYEQERTDAAEKLGIARIQILDKEVSKARKENSPDSSAGKIVSLHEPKPWHEPVNGAEVLQMAADAINRHMVIRSADADAAALWAMHAHVFNVFSHSARFLITAPDAECGKTVLMSHMIGNMVTRPQAVELLKPAPFFRLAEAFQPTFLIDEADVFLREDADLLAAINNGWEPHGGVIRSVGDDNEVKLFSTHCPVALAGIEMHKHLPATTISRSIVVHLERAADDEIADEDIYDKRQHQKHIRDIGRRMARWCEDNKTALSEAAPAMPEKVRNRLADKWRPLFAIAELAGGDWLTRVHNAMFAQVDMSEPSKALQLLSDLRKVIPDGEKGIWTSDLIKALCKLDEAPWTEYNFRERDEDRKHISDRQIARLLKRYGLHPEDIRFGSQHRKGYYTAKVEAVARRYLPELNATTRQTSNSNGFDNNSGATNVADENTSATTETHKRDATPAPDIECRADADISGSTTNAREQHAQNWRDRINSDDEDSDIPF